MATAGLRDFVDFAQFLMDRGVAPHCVVDVGVASGTPGILDFPDCYYVLVEALPEFEVDLRELLESRDGEFHLCAAGDSNYRAQLRRGSTIWDASLIWEPRPEDPVVDVRRLDGLIRNEVLRKPALIKFDIQGHELAALDGLGSLLDSFDYVIVEATLNPMKGPDLADLVIYLHRRGFVVYDIIGVENRPLDGALGQIDLVFVPMEADIRANKQWAQTQ